jgi:hypothetical protein
MLADIASGNTDTADAFFLIAAILALLAAILYAIGARPVHTTDGVARTNVGVWAPTLGWLAVACAAFALLQL